MEENQSISGLIAKDGHKVQSSILNVKLWNFHEKTDS